MSSPTPIIRVPLSVKPVASIMALAVHGPRVTERFSSHLWWLHFYRYSATLRILGADLKIEPCTVSIIPPGQAMEYDFVDKSVHLCAHFQLPASHDQGVESPLLLNLGDQFPAMYDQFEEAVSWFGSNRTRAEVRLWDLLWRLIEPTPKKDIWVHNHPGPVRQARAIIELKLAENIGVADLADEVGVSHNHLIRLFHQSTGTTVVGYIRQRKAERAEHLLKHTTLPIKTIAAQVGFDEPRQFYKLMIAHFGMSPSMIRSKGDTQSV